MSTNEAGNVHSPLHNPRIHITTHSSSGKATLYNSHQNSPLNVPEYKTAINLVYTTSTMPVDLNDEIDIKHHDEIVKEGTLGLVKSNGTVCRFVDFAPGCKGLMHRTQSLDYGVVLEGNMVMELDDGSNTPMTRGDVAVQRATMHAWRNPSNTEWARMMFVLQDCRPVVVEGQRFREELGHVADIFPESGNDAE